MSINPIEIRKQFPSLEREAVFFDNPGGTQIARHSLDRIHHYLLRHNANHDGVFATSRESDIILDQAHTAMAALLNAASPNEIVFGANMTTLTFAISRSIAREWQPGDSIVVTHLDHDANISPWILAAQDRGVNIVWVNFHVEDGTLNLEEMQAAIERKPKLVAVGYASNALGTINPVKQIIEWAHAAGSLVYIDAVQYAPHGPIDVQDIACDFLVCSAYKFFGPHVGVLYGRYDLLERLQAYKVRPASDEPPGKFETGTLNHEGLAGTLGACEYFEWLGAAYGTQFSSLGSKYSGKRLAMKQGLCAVQEYELEISRKLLEVLKSIPGLKIYGISDPARLEERVPTYSFTQEGMHPTAIAEQLARANIFTWDGNYYALAVTQRLGLEDSGGMVRVGPVHYNTPEEIQRFGVELGRIVEMGG